MRLRSTRGRPWRRGHLGRQGEQAALGARHALFTSILTIEQVLERYNSASPAAPLLIQQGHYRCGQGHRPSLRCARFLPRRAHEPGARGVKYGRATSITAMDKPLKELHALGTGLAGGATARLERRAPRCPPRGVVRLGPPMGVCALQTTHAGARSSSVAGGLCRRGWGRRLGGGWLRRHLHAFCSTHA
jgi:hypothetical protein